MNALTRRQLLRAGAGAAAVVLAGCSSDGESGPTTGAPPTGTAGTTGPSTTAAPTTAAPTTAAPTTSPAPPSTVPAGAVEDLRRRLSGNVITPLDASYPAAGLPANTRYVSTRPAVIASCRDEADVVTCVQRAVENGVPPSAAAVVTATPASRRRTAS